MNRGKMTLKVIPLLIGMGIVLSACAVDPGYDAYGYGYNYPIYGSLNFDFCCDRDRHDFHDRGDHGFGGHGHR